MKFLIKIILAGCLLSIAVLGYSRQAMGASKQDSVTGELTCLDKKTLQLRSKFSFSAEKFLRDGKVIYRFTESGKGDYDQYKRVSWQAEAETEEKNGFLYLIYGTRIIKDEAGNTIIKYEKRFNYDRKEIDFVAASADGKIIKKATFPLKGLTTDETAMPHFLKAFVACRNKKACLSFYLISNEPKLYRINIKVIGPEILELPLGKIKSIKLRLIPDLGLLTGVVRAIVPPTFVWYTEQSPYNCLKYEGLETGLGSTHIVNYLSKQEPFP